ncbi:ABC transporter permease [Rhizobium leguminosarum]|uniref:ABC transporter permease n=1 Tax=Rhizobium leguminosarum TaxID=384 RepID=UPI001F3F5909|nr:ABC transporter permease [Rhizobium leguminosarum]UIJ83185.1 ABC transporter permease [Rhizobium leguminosarum]
MNIRAIQAIYRAETVRWSRTLTQSFVTPVLSTSLYFVVFGAAIGSHIDSVDGVEYGAFILPGLTMLLLLQQSVLAAAIASCQPRFYGTIYEIVSAPISHIEVVLAYAGAAATKSLILGFTILAIANFFIDFTILHPFWMVLFMLLTAMAFSLIGFAIGIWADTFEKLQLIPMLVITPLAFLGGTFYTISALPPFWQKVAYFNPLFYLIAGLRWSFYGGSNTIAATSVGITLAVIAAAMALIAWIFSTGYKLRS